MRLPLVGIIFAAAASAHPGDGGPMALDGGFSVSARYPISALPQVPYPLGNGNGVQLSLTGPEGLVVWKDDRDYQNMLYASRVNALGQVLDPGGIRLVQSVSQGWGVVPF